MSQHQAKFTWGAGPNSVHIAGSFNNWSDSATPLHKQPDGSFLAEVPVPFGEKQAFKYVVDGEWKVREDEAKEWDAAGNMNNVYTAPHPPTPAATETSTSAPSALAALPASAENKEEKEASVPTAAATTVPAASTEDTPAPVKSEPTQPETLLASSAPGAALSAFNLGAPIAGGSNTTAANEPVTAVAAEPVTAVAAEPVTATAAVPIEKAPVTTDSTPVQIQKTAANANIGEAPVNGHEKSLQEQAVEYGAGALAAVGGVLGGAMAAVERKTGIDMSAVERATGIDLHHGSPISVEEAQARGIDIKTLEQTELGTDATSPVGTKPPASAVAALEEKTKELKLDSAAKNQAAVPLPNGEPPKSSYANAPEPIGHKEGEPVKHDIPAQNETSANHQTVPAPVITAVSGKDPKKDRTLDAPTNNETAGTQPISSDPAVDASKAKKEAEAHPAGTGSTPATAQGIATAPPTSANNVSAGETHARPDAPANNLKVDSPPTPAKDVATPAPVAPATPAKSTVPAAGSVNSTPASTPAKSSHVREETGGSDVRKRKSSFFHKIKSAFSPKDKEKK